MGGVEKDPHESVATLRAIPIRENGDPLVDFVAEGKLILDTARFTYRRATLVREPVYRMLLAANADLARDGLELRVIEGWRSPKIQRRMFLAVKRRFRKLYPHFTPEELREYTERYTAPITGEVPPPHSTGGAVDLALYTTTGEWIHLYEGFGDHDERCFPFACDEISPRSREFRDRMAAALLASGLTCYPSEFWHWTYGDQGWAYRTDAPHALYAAVEPDGYPLDPQDDVDAPLDYADGSDLGDP